MSAIEVANLLGTAAILLLITVFKKYTFAYSTMKGENQAVKEDIEEITRKIEGVRNDFTTALEQLKSTLELQSWRTQQLKLMQLKCFDSLVKLAGNIFPLIRSMYIPSGEDRATLAALHARTRALFEATTFKEVDKFITSVTGPYRNLVVVDFIKARDEATSAVLSEILAKK